MNQYSYIDFKFEQGNGKLYKATVQDYPLPTHLEGVPWYSCLRNVLQMRPRHDPDMDCLDRAHQYF